MKSSFWGLLWSSFQDIQGLWIGMLGFIGSVLLIRFPFKTPVPLDLIIIFSFFTLLFLFTLMRAIEKILTHNRKLEEEAQQFREINQKLEIEIKQRVIPKILLARKDPATNVISCLLEPSELFFRDSDVCCYYTDNEGFENLVGVGYVYIIQNNQKLQVLIDKPVPAYQDILNKLANNDQSIKEKMIVKPGNLRSFNLP
jgi:hypothetical protein